MAKGFQSFALTDQGIRDNNEDLVYNDDALGVYFVIDGMGGHAAGEQAARIAAERLLGRLKRATGSPGQRIREAITLANNAIFEASQKEPEWNGMACVLTVALVSPWSATIGHVGDSRLYKIRATAADEITITKLTRDHSPVGELEDGGQISEAEAMSHPRRNEVYRDVGTARRDPDDKDFIDIYSEPAEPDSAFLLCSDGLTDAVPRADIEKIIRENANNLRAAARALIQQAIDHAGKDNISVVLVRGPAFADGKGDLARTKEFVIEPAVQAAMQNPPQSLSWRRLGLNFLSLAVAAALGTTGALWGFWALQAYLHRPGNPPPPRTPAADTRAPATILVNARLPNAVPTIASALSSAAEGDTIVLAPGFYDEPIRIEKSNLFIDGSGALLRPRATADGSDGVTISGAAGVRIQNLRISGDADGDLLTGISVLNSQVWLHNVHVTTAAGPGIEVRGSSVLKMDASSIRDCDGPGLVLRGPAGATVKYSAIVGNGRDPHDRQPGILIDSTQPVTISGNTIANNGGPAIQQTDLPSQSILTQNLFSLDGRPGRLDDVRAPAPRKRTQK